MNTKQNIGIKIRKMRPEDMDSAMALLAEWNMAPVVPTPEIPDPERTGIEMSNAFVAFVANRLVGICSYYQLSDSLAETASLAVDPEYKGTGVGYALQVARLAEMKSKSIRKIRTESDRVEAIDWYVKNFGYTVIGRNRKKHPFGLESIDYWTVLELDLE
jgi:N-acetylglutamate synthase-like GNAT family acetyltransferase